MLKVILLTITMLILSCHSSVGEIIKTSRAGTTKTSTKKEIPVKSFAKIIKTLHVKKCKKMNITPCKDGDKFTSVGSGVSVGKTSGGSLILTAGHVCTMQLSENAKSLMEEHEIIMEAININNEKRKAIIISSIVEPDGADLCLLFVEGLETEGILLSDEAPKVGDKVYNIAAPAGIFHPPTVPIMHGIFSGPVNDSNAMVTVPAIGGSSGSAIIDEDMRLVGILFATHPGFNTITLCSTYEVMAIFLNEGIKKFLAMKLGSTN